MIGEQSYPTLRWSAYLDTEMGARVLVDIDSAPTRCRMDYWRRNDNIISGKELCLACDAKGNACVTCYMKCEDCDGTGLKQNEN
jgi:hypothetical protein